MDLVAAVTLAAVCTILSACLVLVIVQHAGAERAWAAERERLVQLVAARDGREFAVMRKASEPKAPPADAATDPAFDGDRFIVGLG